MSRGHGEAITQGTLYVVATPIGNREDVSERARRVLAEVDVVAAEDTRHTGMLLKAYGLKKAMISCYAHNEERQSGRIIEMLLEGKAVALVSDAGMPGISDPGARLVRQAIDAEIKLSVIPGPSAVITALAASGLDTDTFAFGGFFPRTNKERRAWMDRFSGFQGTVVFYESPKRLLATLHYILEAWGDRYCCIARELTKRYEEFIRGSLTEVYETLMGASPEKGEIVVVIDSRVSREDETASPEEALVLGRTLLDAGMGKKEASRELAAKTGMSANACYALLLKMP